MGLNFNLLDLNSYLLIIIIELYLIVNTPNSSQMTSQGAMKSSNTR